MKLEKKHRDFTSAYEYQFGTKWNWKNDDGTENHPALSNDDNVRMFYNGWRLAKNGQKFYMDKLKTLERIEEQLRQIKKELL
jgi:hypothetical protein